MKKIFSNIIFGVLSAIPFLGIQGLAYSQAVDFGADSRYDGVQDTYNGNYPGSGYDAFMKSILLVNSLSSPLPANRASWRISSQGYFNIPNDLPASFVSNGVTWTKTFYFYDPVDGPVSDVRYENTTPIPLDYEGSFIFKAKTARPTPGGTQALIGWNTQIVAINGATDNQTANDSYDAPITVGSNPLPVTLSSFNATKEGQTAILSWATTEETNSDRFEIEHSWNAKNWNSIGTVKSKGESKVLEKYSFIHAEPVEGENLYRLKMIDQDESFAYSRIVSVTFGAGAGAQIYPNPASDYLLIKSVEWKSVSKLKILNLNGQNVFESSGKTLSNQIDIRKMDAGVYLLEILKNNGQKDLRKFVVVR